MITSDIETTLLFFYIILQIIWIIMAEASKNAFVFILSAFWAIGLSILLMMKYDVTEFIGLFILMCWIGGIYYAAVGVYNIQK